MAVLVQHGLWTAETSPRCLQLGVPAVVARWRGSSWGGGGLPAARVTGSPVAKSRWKANGVGNCHCIFPCLTHEVDLSALCKLGEQMMHVPFLYAEGLINRNISCLGEKGWVVFICVLGYKEELGKCQMLPGKYLLPLDSSNDIRLGQLCAPMCLCLRRWYPSTAVLWARGRRWEVAGRKESTVSLWVYVGCVFCDCTYLKEWHSHL